MAKTIFDLLNDVTYNKIPWEDQSDTDKKAFSPYMVNRFLSMNVDYLDVIAEVQKHTMSMEPGIVYEFYRDFLPKKKVFSKYISAAKDSTENLEQLITFFAKKYNISEKESAENLELLLSLNKLENIKVYLKKHGYKDEELQLLFKEKGRERKTRKSK